MSAARRLQRQIHLACRQLGIDADTRHALQLRVTGKESMAAMTEAELAAVVEDLKRQGFETGFKGRSKTRKAPASRPDLRYIHVLWGLLGKAGVLHKPGRAGLNAFLRTRFGPHWESVPIDIDALRDPAQINDVIRALQDMCRRHKVRFQR